MYVKCPHCDRGISEHEGTASPRGAHEGEYGDWYGEFEYQFCQGHFSVQPYTEYHVQKLNKPKEPT